MRYKLLGNSGLRVSDIALDKMTLGDKPNAKERASKPLKELEQGRRYDRWGRRVGAGVFNEYYDITKVASFRPIPKTDMKRHLADLLAIPQ